MGPIIAVPVAAVVLAWDAWPKPSGAVALRHALCAGPVASLCHIIAELCRGRVQVAPCHALLRH